MVARPEYIEQIIERMRQAAELNRKTPARHDNVVMLDADNCDEVVVAGDLHGNRRNFNALRKVASLDKYPKRHLVLQEVVHGGPTYDDGGCMSFMLLEDVAKLKLQYPDRVHFLLSNHELSEATEYLIRKANAMLNLQFRLGMEQMYGADVDRVREAYKEFILSCPLAVRVPQGVFISHSIPGEVDRAGFDRGVFWRQLSRSDISPGGPAFKLVWDRDYRRENAAAFASLMQATTLIIGHEPCDEGYATPNDLTLILDCAHPKAKYLILPCGRTWQQESLLQCMQSL